jgi:hypothetical protein
MTGDHVPVKFTFWYYTQKMFFATFFLMKNMATEVLYCSVNTWRIAIIKATMNKFLLQNHWHAECTYVAISTILETELCQHYLFPKCTNQLKLKLWEFRLCQITLSFISVCVCVSILTPSSNGMQERKAQSIRKQEALFTYMSSLLNMYTCITAWH